MNISPLALIIMIMIIPLLKSQIILAKHECFTNNVIIGLQCVQRALLSSSLLICFPGLHSPWLAVRKRKLWEQPFWNNKENNWIRVIRFTAQSASMHMPEMVAPRALVSRPLVKGNKALGTRLAPCMHCRPMTTDSRSCHHRLAIHAKC